MKLIVRYVLCAILSFACMAHEPFGRSPHSVFFLFKSDFPPEPLPKRLFRLGHFSSFSRRRWSEAYVFPFSQMTLDHFGISDRNHFEKFWQVLIPSIENPFCL